MESISSAREFLKRTTNSRFASLIRIVAVGAVTALILLLPRLYHSIWPTPYKATQDNFQIVFPQTPTIHSLARTKDGVGGSEASRVYNDLDQKSNADYAVYVIRFAGSYAQSLSVSGRVSNLQYNIEQLAQNYTSSLSGGMNLTFKGSQAVEATLTPSAANTSKTLVIAFFHRNDLYMLIGGGINQSKFNSFINSFKII